MAHPPVERQFGRPCISPIAAIKMAAKQGKITPEQAEHRISQLLCEGTAQFVTRGNAKQLADEFLKRHRQKP